MGYYTEFYFKAKLRRDTPKQVVELLNRVINQKDLGIESIFFQSSDVFVPDVEHEFFKNENWYSLFLGTNWSEHKPPVFMFMHTCWILEIDSEFQHFYPTIDHFLEWIKPHLTGHKPKQYVGWYKPESFEQRVNLYIERSI